MEEREAQRIADGLRKYGIMAAVARPAAFRFGIRVPLGDGREALWDVDGAAGLEAQVMANGVLVGFVPQIPGSDRFTEEQTVEAIARADYGKSPGA
jgi:cation diffusion facilitator CzcD-associated flavoprotein CzcO